MSPDDQARTHAEQAQRELAAMRAAQANARAPIPRERA